MGNGNDGSNNGGDGGAMFHNLLQTAELDRQARMQFNEERKGGRSLADIMQHPTGNLQMREGETNEAFRTRLLRMEGYLKTDIYEELRVKGYSQADIMAMGSDKPGCGPHYDPKDKQVAKNLLGNADFGALEAGLDTKNLDPEAAQAMMIVTKLTQKSCVSL